jgi:hypothetical protein
MMTCDFCSAPNPPYKIDCVPFVMDSVLGVNAVSDSAWAACAVCYGMVQRGDWELLINRVVATYQLPLANTEKRIYRAYLKALYTKLQWAMRATA